MPTLERIMQAAVNSLSQGKREAHCFSAHVQGQGYVNRGDNPETRADYIRQLVRAAQSEVDNLNYAPGYAEPGYSDPERGVVFANWNYFPRGLDDILERAGYAVEWSDEWSTCNDCGRAVRTSPDSMGYAPYYNEKLIENGEFVCLDCAPIEENEESDKEE